MTYSDLYDAAEPWFLGDPEVEVHILGPDVGDAKTSARQIHCSGATEPGWYNFDQNSNQWSGAALLLSETQLIQYGYTPGNPSDHSFLVVMYEDDDQACVIHDTPGRLENDLTTLGLVGVGTIITIFQCDTGQCFGANIALLAGFAITAVVDLFSSNDGYWGAATLGLTGGYNNSLSTHTLYKHDSVVNGGIRLTYHTFGQ